MKPTIEVTGDNYKMLQVLDMMQDISYSRHSLKETGKRIQRYLNGYTVDEVVLNDDLMRYSEETRENLINTRPLKITVKDRYDSFKAMFVH